MTFKRPGKKVTLTDLIIKIKWWGKYDWLYKSKVVDGWVVQKN